MNTSLNKVIEQVAYKQVEDMIVLMEMLSEQIIQTSKTAKANQISLGTPSSSNNEMNKKLIESSTIIKKLQKEHKDLQNSYDALAKKVDTYSNAKRNNTSAITNNSVAQSQLLKLTKEEETLNTQLTTYIQKLSVERLREARIIQDLTAKKTLGNELTEKEVLALNQATVAHQKLDAAIKAGKTATGDAREFVGQYERANVGLSNSIGQIARELPAATFGFQTFALGISNNIPIAVDEIKKAVAINKELIAQGKPVTSIWKQIGGALLSFNSIMSVGLLLLALYGKEIANFTKELFGADTALETVTNRQKEFNKARLEGKKDAQTDIIELRKYLAVVKDRTIADDLRQVALKKLRADYPYYFKNLTDEQILTGKTSEAVKQLTKDLEKRKEVEKKTDLNVQNRQRLIQLEDEIDKTNVLLNKANEKTKQAEQLSFAEVSRGKLLSQAQDEEAKQRTILNKLIDERDVIQGKTIKNEEDIFNLKTETIALEYQDTKAKDENTKSLRLNTKAREDYLASEYELWRLRKQNESDRNKDLMDIENIGYDIRLMASERYYQNQIDLANRQAQEEIRVLNFATEEKLRTSQNEYLNDKDRLTKQLNDENTTAEQKKIINKELFENKKYFEESKTGIVKDATNQQNIIYENQAQRLIDINLEAIGVMKRAYDEINFGKAEIEIANVDLAGIEKVGKALNEIGAGFNTGQIELKLREVNRLSSELSLDIQKREADLQVSIEENNIKRLIDETLLYATLNNLSDEDTSNLLINNKALQDAELKLIEAKKKKAEVDNQTTNQEIENDKLKAQAKEDLYAFELESALRLSSDLGNLSNQLFQNNIDRYDREIEKSNEYYDALIERAEKGSEQEKLLLEEKAKAEEELQRRRIAVQRKQALFNKILSIADIAINLQLELSKNAATTGTIPAAVLNGIAIASAAIRTATILATPLPQYKDGTDFHKGGKAVLGDGYVNEVVENPDGSSYITPKVPTIMNLKKGAKVYPSVEKFNKSKLDLENASIMASFANQSNQLKAFDYYLGKELSGLPSKIEKGIEKGFKKVKNNINVTNKIDLDHYNYKKRGFNA